MKFCIADILLMLFRGRTSTSRLIFLLVKIDTSQQLLAAMVNIVNIPAIHQHIKIVIVSMSAGSVSI